MKDKNVVVLAVNLQDSKDQIRKYFEENKFTFRPVMQKSDEISRAYGVSAYPTNYVVGPDGKIVFRSVGYDEEGLKGAIGKVAK